MAASLARTGVLTWTLALAAAPAAAEPPDMLAGGFSLIADQGLNGQFELRYGRPIRPGVWWTTTGGIGIAGFDPADGGGHDGMTAELRTGLLLRGCNLSLCGGVGTALGAQHRRLSYDAVSDAFPAYQNRQTSLLGDARLHAQYNWDDDGRAGFELTLGLRYQYIVAQSNTAMTAFDNTRSPSVIGIVLGAGIVGSL